MDEYIYKDDEIKITDLHRNDDDILYHKVYIYDKIRGYFYYDSFSCCYGYAFGNSFRGRYYYSKDRDDSIVNLIEDLHRVYHMGKYAQGARLW